MLPYRAVVLGAGGVGKSALTVRFMKNTFADGYDPTIEETYRKTMTVDGETCMLDVLDTAGAEQFTALSEHYIQVSRSKPPYSITWRSRSKPTRLTQGAMGYILVFSLTQESSMREIEALRFQIHRIRGLQPPAGSPTANSPLLPIVIVGTKSDLIGEREVSREVMTQLSRMWGCPFYETSAKNNWNVNEVFEEIVKQMQTKLSPEQRMLSQSQLQAQQMTQARKKKKGSRCITM